MEHKDGANSTAAIGFTYTVDHYRAGKLLASDTEHNLIPTQGLNHALGVLLKGDTQVSSWYIGLFEGNYTPTPTATGATIVALSTESTAYTEATRQAWVGGAVANGAVTNEDNRAAFTINATKTIYGGFMVSSPVKGASSDFLLSAVRFSSPKNVEAGDILRVRAAFTNVSAV